MLSDGRRTGRRLTAGVATLLLHAALIALLLDTGVAQPIAVDQRPFAVFDVSLPKPPPPPPETMRPPEPRRTKPQPALHPHDAGGTAAVVAVRRQPIEQPAPVALAVASVPDIPVIALATAATAGSTPATGATDLGGKGQGSGIGDGNGDRVEGSAPQRFRRAEWITRPTDDEINRYWPSEAIRRRIGGKVYLACAFTRPGKPDRCISIYEVPAGVGFGEAAVRLSKTFRIRPIRINDHDATDLPVIVPVTFTAKK